MKTSLLPACLLAVLLPLVSVAADKAPPTVEELWEIIQKQQAEIEALKNQQQDTAKQAADADEKAEAAVVAIEESTTGDSSKANWTDRMEIGGYGELHYNNINNDGIDDKKEIDFHRFVLFFGYEFTEKLRFWSELELEHALAGDGKPAPMPRGAVLTVEPRALTAIDSAVRLRLTTIDRIIDRLADLRGPRGPRGRRPGLRAARQRRRQHQLRHDHGHRRGRRRRQERQVRTGMDRSRDDHGGNLSCSFCGKSQKEVKKLIAGPSVYICNECIKLCNDILEDELRRRGFFLLS